LYNISWKSWPYYISSLLAIIGCAVVVLFPFFLVFLVWWGDIENKNFVVRFGGVY